MYFQQQNLETIAHTLFSFSKVKKNENSDKIEPLISQAQTNGQ